MSTTSKKTTGVSGRRPPFTIDLTEEQRKKLRRMIGYCLADDLEANNGLILRTLVDNMPDESPEFRKLVRAQDEKEHVLSLAKRRRR